MDAINLTGRLNLTVNTAKVEAQLAALGKQAPIKITTTLPTAQLRAYREELTRVRKASKEVEDGFSDFAEKAALAGKRFAAFTVATTGFFALASAIKSGISNASEFEVELLKVQQVTRESARNISGLKESIFGVAKGLGVSSKELLSVGLTLGQAGRSIQEIKDSLAPLAKTRLAATFGDITDTVNALIAAQEQFKVTSKDTEQVLGSINVLSAKYAVEAQDLTTAIQKAGGAFSSFADSAAEPKKNLNELLALFTAVRSTTRESADTIATGFRTIFARLRNPKNISALEAFGINLKDDKGLLLKPLEQIRAISRAVKDLDKRDIRFSQIIEEVGGIRQQSKVIPLLQQMEKAEQALVTATQGANSLTRDAQIAQESLANQLAKTREEFLKLINDGFSSEEFRNFAKVTLGIASALIKVGEAIGPLLPAFATLAATKFLLPDAAGQLSGYQKVTKAVRGQFGPKELPKKFASGGTVGGSGSGDKVPAMLEPGEFVIPKSATRKLGHGFLESLRRGEKPPGYSTGGGPGYGSIIPGRNKIINSVEEATKIAETFFKAFGLNIKSSIKSIEYFTNKELEELKKAGKNGVRGAYSEKTGVLKLRKDSATTEILSHEIGHAIHSALTGEAKQSFEQKYSKQDPYTDDIKHQDLSKHTERDIKGLNKILDKSGKLTEKEIARLDYLSKPREIVARGFAQNPGIGPAPYNYSIDEAHAGYTVPPNVNQQERLLGKSTPVVPTLAITPPVKPQKRGVKKEDVISSNIPVPGKHGYYSIAGSPPVIPHGNNEDIQPYSLLAGSGKNYFQTSGFPYKPSGFSKLSNSLLGDSGVNPNSVIAGLSRFETPPTKTKLGLGTIDSLSESVQKDPMKASLISFTLLGLSEKFTQADDATARFAKAITTGASQFILLNTVLSTFGRTAKQKALLEQESEQHLGQQSILDQKKGVSVKRSGLLTNIQDLDKSKFNDESRIKATQGILEDLSNQHGNLKLSSSQREDLTTVRQLSKLNEALLNPDTKHKQSLIGKIGQAELSIKSYDTQLKNVGSFTRVDKKAQAGGAKVSKGQRLHDDLLKKKEAAERAHQNYKSQYDILLKGQATPFIVTDLVQDNKNKISGILSKPENTNVGGTGAGLLNVSDRISQIQQKKRVAHQNLKKLKQSHGTNSKLLNTTIKEIQELDKSSEELARGLDTPENRQRFSDSHKLNNNIQVPARPPNGFLERIIGTKRATKEDLEKRSKLEGRLAFGSAVASGVGGLVTSFGQDNLKNTPDSGVGRGLAAAGSAATLGAEFAAIGTTIHPVIGIIGGLGGALYGFKKNLDETGNAIQDIAIDKNLTEFAKLVELVNDKEKRGGVGTNIKNASNLVSDTQNRVLSTGTKESRDKAENLAANAQNLLRGFAQTIGENNGTLKKFNEEGKTLIEFVSRFSNTSLKELDSQFKKIIEDTSKLSKANKQQIAISEREQTRGILSTGILGAFEDVSTSLNEFEAVLNGGISDLSSVFKRIGQISDSQLLERANKQAGSVLGRVEGGADFLKENQLINEIGRELPTLLVEAFRNTKNPLEGQGPVETLSATLSERFKLPEQSSIKDSIVGQLIEATKNKSSSEIADLIQSNLKSGLVDPILSNLVKIGDVSTQAVQLRNQELKFLEGIYSRIGELNTNIRESQLGVVDLEEKRQIGLSPSNDIGLQRKLGFESQRLSIISGRSDNNVGSLAGVLGRARGRLKSIDEEKQSGEKDGLNDLAKRRSVELETISRVTKALDYLGKSAIRLSNIEESISKEKSLRDTKVGILKQYAFGSPDQKRESAQNLQIAQKLLETQDIRSVPGNLLQGGVGILEQFKDASYGGQKIDDIITKLAIQGGGLSGDLASQLGITKGKSEKDLEKDRDNAIIEAQSALVASQNDLKSQTENLTSAINTQFPSFIENLTKLLLGNRETDLSIKFAQNQGKLDKVSTNKVKAEELSKLLGPAGLGNLGNTDISTLKTVLPELKKLKNLQSEQTKAETIGKLTVSGKNERISKKEALEGVDTNFQKLQEVFGVEVANKISNDTKGYIQSKLTGTVRPEDVNNALNSSVASNRKMVLYKNIKDQEESSTKIGRSLEPKQITAINDQYHNIVELFGELDEFNGGNLSQITKEFNELGSSLDELRLPLQSIRKELGTFSGPIRPTQSAINEVGQLNLTGGLGFATGGGVPGLGNFDSVPAMLTPGEFVIRKSAAEALGPEVLNQLNGYNKGGRVKFGGGGEVENPLPWSNLDDTAPRHRHSHEFLSNPNPIYSEKSDFEKKYEANPGSIQFKGPITRMREYNKSAIRKMPKPKVYGQQLSDRALKSKLATGRNPQTKHESDIARSDVLERRRQERAFSNPIKRSGGGGTGPSQVSGASRGITCELNTESIEKFNKAISEFSKPADRLSEALSKIPSSISLDGKHVVEVLINGADAFAKIQPEIEKMIVMETKKAINMFIDTKLVGVGRMV